MDQGCSVLDCFFFLRPLISCLLTHPPILSFFFILSGLPQEDWPRTPSSPSLPPHPRPLGLYARFFLERFCCFSVFQEGGLAIIFISFFLGV